MAKGVRRWAIATCTAVLVLVTISIYQHHGLILAKNHIQAWAQVEHLGRDVVVEPAQEILGRPFRIPKQHPTANIGQTHHEVFSQTSESGEYIRLDFGDYEGTNPSFIPHPQLDDTWIMVAQQQKSNIENTVWFAQLVCLATFQDGVLRCTKSPLTLPIAATTSPHCIGDYEHFSWNIGPHDARVFYGPQNPSIIYGSNSAFSCFGLWAQDFRLLTDWGREESPPQPFSRPTDLQRPPPSDLIEKNWFFFWDVAGQMYLHHSISPTRVFARVEADGSAGEDLSAATRESDAACMARYLPALPPAHESLHQATNSLSVTLCARSDPACTPDAENTFVMAIVQHKKFYDLHSVYEPYVLLFRAEAPFQLHAVSGKPLWIHGRGVAGEKRPAKVPAEREWSQTEMLYVTSVSWRDKGLRYHGHEDDVLLVGFGIEDETSGVLDVRASDLLEVMAVC